MKKQILAWMVAGLVCVAWAGGSLAGEPSAYVALVEHYEAVRYALLHDGLAGVEDHARAIKERASALSGTFDYLSAGVPQSRAAECEAILPAVVEAAQRLRDAEALPAAREAFGDLSDALIRYRELVSDAPSVVVHCSMAKKSWIQPKGEIGNPYYGQSMARCGEIVSQ